MENTLLESRTEEHVKIFWEKSQDEELESLFPFIRNTLEDAIRMYKGSLKTDARSFGKVITVDGTYVGDVWCYAIDEEDEKQAFVSIVIFDKAYWGGGIGKKALKQFCQLVFDRYSIDKLCAFTYKSNIRSRGVMESIGFEKIEEFEEEGILSCYYELLRV